jgi:hypothetical protein
LSFIETSQSVKAAASTAEWNTGSGRKTLE